MVILRKQERRFDIFTVTRRETFRREIYIFLRPYVICQGKYSICAPGSYGRIFYEQVANYLVFTVSTTRIRSPCAIRFMADAIYLNKLKSI